MSTLESYLYYSEIYNSIPGLQLNDNILSEERDCVTQFVSLDLNVTEQKFESL